MRGMYGVCAASVEGSIMPGAMNLARAPVLKSRFSSFIAESGATIPTTDLSCNLFVSSL